MDPGQTPVAGPSQACAPNPARHRPFDTSAAGILRLTRVGRLPWPCDLERLLVRLGPDGQCPPWITLLRAYALGSWLAAPTILGRALHLDHGIPAMIHGRRPACTGLPSGADRVWLVPIDLEVLGVKAGPCTGLPVIVKACGPQPIHAVVVLTLNQPFGIQNAGVHDRGTR
jgi:hypothetical protein